MGTEIHAIRKGKKSYQYREYSTTSDMYQTPPLTKKEIIRYLLYKSLDFGFQSLPFQPLEILKRLERARTKGTSCMGDSRTFNSWEKVPQDYWGNRFAREKKRAFIADIKKFLKMPLYQHLHDRLENGKRYLRKDIPEELQSSKKIDGLIALLFLE